MIVFVIVGGVAELDDEVEAEVEEGADAMEAKLWYHDRKAKIQENPKSERNLYCINYIIKRILFI